MAMPVYISPYLSIPLVAWIFSQGLKYLIQSIKSRSFSDYSFLYTSGNMPSSHAALMISLLTVIGFKDGPASALFGVITVLTMIVLYDAANVRRAVGEQGKVVTRLVESLGRKETFYTAQGHSVAEVFAGSVTGFTVAILLLQFL